MKSLAAFASVLLTVGIAASPALARDSFVLDNAHLFSADTVSTINANVAAFNATTHKEVFVDTEPTVDGASPQAAAEKIFAAQQINGVLIYVAKSPKTIGVVPDAAAKNFFPAASTSAIRSAIVSAFNSGDYNGGITNGVNLTLSQYRSHLGALTRQKTTYAAPVGSGQTIRSSQAGFNMSWIWMLIILAVIFFVIRGIFRAMAGPRMMPPGYGGGGPMMGGPGYGGPGYGPGYGGGFGGGGGGFWSGLMGGLGGAFLGNELFGRRDDFGGGGQQAGFVDGGQQSSVDNSGFQSDAGQADMSNASFGGWGGGDSGSGTGGGDSGGGWGGGGDSGGGWGGGGDFGGGGGDNSGGGW